VAETDLRQQVRPLAAPRNHHSPDLCLLIFEHVTAGTTTLSFHLKALDHELGLNYKRFPSQQLEAPVLRDIQRIFRTIEELHLSVHEQAAIERHLASKGHWMFEVLFPQEVQSLLWALRNRIESVQIVSMNSLSPGNCANSVGQKKGAWSRDHSSVRHSL
jgi:hypothetical protein